ncbi:MAG: NAD(P)H-dependent oxidoreductase [Pseudomonadota bacterium]
MTQRRILLLFAHPSLERSEVNHRLLNVAHEHDSVTSVDLYAEYPDYRIDIDVEQQRLRDHEVVVFLFPLYWYSTPAILKEWQDLVLEHGFAYGHEGHALKGKYFIAACSAGGPAKAYAKDGYNHFTLRELLRPLEQTANLCHMRYLPPFALFGARTAVEEARLSDHVVAFRDLLEVLREGDLDAWESSSVCTVNELFPEAASGEASA